MAVFVFIISIAERESPVYFGSPIQRNFVVRLWSEWSQSWWITEEKERKNGKNEVMVGFITIGHDTYLIVSVVEL